MSVDCNLMRFHGVRCFSGKDVLFSLGILPDDEIEKVSAGFSALVQDRQMGDGGHYRFRRYSRFRLEPGSEEPYLMEGNTILQSLRDNPLNGGVARTFEPLGDDLVRSTFLRRLLAHDLGVVKRSDPELFHSPVVVGVHQVRIVAVPQSSGKPTPEGIHRDAERFTFQHFWNREGVSGGEFRAYDESQEQILGWLQENLLDSVLFQGTTWHSATPIECLAGHQKGHRDIFLVDFDPC
jgi:hypothetical protein